MDCFYAAVEVRDRPELRGHPVAVGGPPESRGVIATASYESRAFGVRSAMATATALRLCPKLIVLPSNFAKYRKESRHIRDIFNRFTQRVEPLSLDEAYLDVTDATHFDGSATRIAQEIRRLIYEETKLTASAGVAPNKFLAKIASDINKPNGLKVILPSEIDEFVKTLPVEKIWGVGKVTARKMHRMGIRTCFDLQKYSVAELTRHFGSAGVSLYDFARGIDHRPVREDRERKSLSVEETFVHDLETLGECLLKLPELYDDWESRMDRADVAHKIQGIFVKLKLHDFKNTTHEKTFQGYPGINDFKPLLEEAFLRRAEPIRLLGIGVRLESSSSEKSSISKQQLKLF